MSILDQPSLWSTLDPQGMRNLIETFPEQFRRAVSAAVTLSLPSPRRIDNLIVAGLGGSAIGGDVVRCAVGNELHTPIYVSRNYGLPGFVNSDSLVFACSYSGNTEETLSAYQEARRLGAWLVCITSGGRLAQMAAADKLPVVSVPGGLPPRAALGYSSVALLGCLMALRLVPDMQEALRETSSLVDSLALRYSAEVQMDHNAAKAMALSLHAKVVAIYASTGLLEAAAVRWRGQIEENAKNLAIHHTLPEMNHNEILGWKYPEEALSGFGVVFLRDHGDHPQVQRRFDLTAEIVRRRAGVVHEVWSEGSSTLARIFSIIYLGDFVSLYLALLNGVDPTSIEAIDYLKRELGR